MENTKNEWIFTLIALANIFYTYCPPPAFFSADAHEGGYATGPIVSVA